MATDARPTAGNVDDAQVADLRTAFSGPVITAADAEYDEARRVWNGSIDRRPAVVARPAGVPDVIAAVRWAARHQVVVAVRGGGHGIAGPGTCDGGIVIDLSSLRTVRVDPEARRAVVDGGALWSDVDRETQPFGLAVTGGLVSTTGVGGFTLGGGIGWLQRKYGLAIDTLVGVDLVTADGSKIHASADEHPELFWGLRGGGGNFGVATAFEFALQPLGPEVVAGLIFHPAEALPELAAFFGELVPSLPDEIMLVLVARTAPPAPFLPPEVHGKRVTALAGIYAGPVEDAAVALRPIKDFGTPIADVMQPRQYTQFQQMLDGSWTAGAQNYWKAEYLRGVDRTVADALVKAHTTITSPLSDFKVAALGGAVARVPADATAYPNRAAPMILNINARWTDPGETATHVGWTQDLWSSVQPVSVGATYVNFMGDEGQDRVRRAYGPGTYERLVALKREYDPTNLFRLNHNIDPRG